MRGREFHRGLSASSWALAAGRSSRRCRCLLFSSVKPPPSPEYRTGPRLSTEMAILRARIEAVPFS
jgi:hypothetical protein